ncbi:J domain-containing protein [Halobellus sp. Atlit-31R]|nr:J domain-containing protein [Halobellus sp. Atlit-31R]
MDRDGLVIGIAAVFAGTTVLLTVLAFVYQPFLLLLAVPFGIATYLLWYHASGRLRDRFRNGVRGGPGRQRATAASRGPRDFEGFGPGRRAAGAAEDRRAGRGQRRATDGRGRSRRTAGPQRSPNEPTRAEAYRTLGLDPDADEADVRAAYRERVKSAHPDTDSGDEEQFKRVNRAYERLTD